MKNHILLLNARRRVFMIKSMNEYLGNNIENYEMATSDTDRLDPIAYSTKCFRVLPPIENEKFKQELLKYIKEAKIKAIVLWNNKDFKYIDKIKTEIEELGCKAFIPEKEKFEICFDKRKTYKFLTENNLPTPKLYKCADEVKMFPVVVKPYDGAGNLNIHKANNMKQLKAFLELTPNPVIQDYIEGTHYTIDTYTDRKLKTFCVVPRERLKVRDAEVVTARIVMKPKLLNVGREVSEAFKSNGPMNIQVIEDSEGTPYVIDMHCRFGGGTDLSIKAGAKFNEWIIQDVLGLKENHEFTLNEHVIMTRYLHSIFIDDNNFVEI